MKKPKLMEEIKFEVQWEGIAQKATNHWLCGGHNNPSSFRGGKLREGITLHGKFIHVLPKVIPLKSP